MSILYIVSTPIGNLGDITNRAIETLKGVDLIACEDTRTSGKLLKHFNINTKTIAYHDHNTEAQTDKLISLLLSGSSIALISDAGTPLISDPGYHLVQATHNNNIKVVPIIGASAVIAALSVSGLPSDKFSFIGFLPSKSVGRKKQLKEYTNRSETLIVYEAPHRILDCLKDISEVFGKDREIAYCRELTKTFETIKKLPVEQLITFIKNDHNQQKGEIVLVIAGFKDNKECKISEHDTLLIRLLEDLSVKKAASLASDITGIKKNALYQRLLDLQKS